MPVSAHSQGTPCQPPHKAGAQRGSGSPLPWAAPAQLAEGCSMSHASSLQVPRDCGQADLFPEAPTPSRPAGSSPKSWQPLAPRVQVVCQQRPGPVPALRELSSNRWPVPSWTWPASRKGAGQSTSAGSDEQSLLPAGAQPRGSMEGRAQAPSLLPTPGCQRCSEAIPKPSGEYGGSPSPEPLKSGLLGVSPAPLLPLRRSSPSSSAGTSVSGPRHSRRGLSHPVQASSHLMGHLFP